MQFAPKDSFENGASSVSYREPLLSGKNRLKYRIAIAVWIAMVLYFWVWWLQPEHNVGTFRYVVVTFAIGWMFPLLLFFFSVSLTASRSSAKLSDLGNPRVAMIVTKTPSEPLDVLTKTLNAMLSQAYPHDTWLADEHPTQDTIDWCKANGVKISTRKDCEAYHQAQWPRRTRCKEGNLAYFYDHYGYESYDFVLQLDSDHIPQAGYLTEVLKHFADPDVGYVTAPSICSGNADKSWAARTRLYTEAMFHGILQSGYSNGWAPLCIGSHYAVRTSALKDIGGLGPELAEDHSTSLIMNAKGWRGVHAIDAIAYGDGPATFTDMLTQEFQWSRSLITLLLRYTPKYTHGLTPKLRFQFIFIQCWYVILAFFMALTFMLPIVALTFDIRFADVTYPAFIGHATPAALVLIWISYQISKDGYLRPHNAKVISWERSLYIFAQWPWVMAGCIAALSDRLFGNFVDFRITPKGDVETARLSNKVILPYLVLAAASIAPVVLVSDPTEAQGFYLLTLMNAAIYSLLYGVIVIRHVIENRIPWRQTPLYHGLQFSVVLLLCGLTASSVWYRGTEGLHFLSAGMGPLQMTDAQFTVAGAGMQADTDNIHYFIDFDWND